ncbi:hypothetical protein WJR50_20810 [Catalinimonas sp. 4WD22]|uniref:hypothetical protein n=1 Tax=Catalinimonas locisalis TaxID=3133978 RepID=UPI003101142C
MINNVDDMMIQRYLDDEMDEDEKMDFEMRLQHMDSLRERVEEYQLIVEGIRYHGEREARQKVRELEAKAAMHVDKQHSIMTNWLYRGVAASLLLLIIGFPIYWQQDEVRNARLFNNKFKPYAVLGGTTRGESTEDEFVLPQAFEAYYNEDYSKARTLFLQASTQEDRPYIWLYLGNAYLGHDENDKAEPQKAVQALEKVLTYSEVDHKTQWRTHWYLGLAHLKLNQEEEAAKHLEIILDTDEYGAEAKDILESIN